MLIILAKGRKVKVLKNFKHIDNRRPAKKKKIGEVLVEAGLITPGQLVESLKDSKKEKKRLGEILIEKKILTETLLIKTLSKHLGIEQISLLDTNVEAEAILMVPEHLARKHNVIPISFKLGNLKLAMSDPLAYDTISDISFYTGSNVKPLLCPSSEIQESIARLYSDTSSIESIVNETVSEFDNVAFSVIPEINLAEDASISIEERTRLAPIIRLTNLIISNAIKKAASDIHIEPDIGNFKIRYRVDGILKEEMVLPKWAQGAVVSRIKILANLDITERKIPQDGSIRIKMNNTPIDMRISTMPTSHGEKVVVRLLSKTQFVLKLESLGYMDDELKIINQLIQKRKGLIIVTGPTGSGKTTTLYSILELLKSESTNIITVENPVEYNLPGITQVQINPDVGLTFGVTLRAMLRQDPDIILLGEIRDAETAELAIRAAMTGHLVFSTLHTNDAISTVSRLKDLNIPEFMISSLLVGVIAQRLVRKICPKCKEIDKSINTKLTPELKALGFTKETLQSKSFYRGAGCTHCNSSGFKGRIGINEIFVPDSHTKELITQGASDNELTIGAVDGGMKTITWDGVQKVQAGYTTFGELTRVVELFDENTNSCKTCGKLIRSTFQACPFCGSRCSHKCESCEKVVEKAWKYCPYCTTSINRK